MTEVVEHIGAVIADLETVAFAVQSGVLRPSPGQSRDDAVALLNLSGKQLSTHADRLKFAYKTSPKQVAKTGKDVGQTLAQLGAAVKSVASTTPDRNTQHKVVVAAKEVVGLAQRYIETAHQASITPDSKGQALLLDASKNLNEY